MATVQEIAREALGYFETFTREGSDDYVTLYRTKEDAPDWVCDMVREAHGDMLPDDWRYKFVVDALDLIADNNPDDVVIEPDIYNVDLMRWASSHASRFNGYCHDAALDYAGSGFMEIIQAAQYAERSEVFGLVLAALEARAEEAEITA